MNAPANMNRQFRGHIFISVITYAHEVDFRVRDSVEAACFGLSARGWLVTPATKLASADLENERNALVAEFYTAKENFTKAVFVDSDVSCDAGSIERLVEHPVDLVLGAYPLRAEGGRYPIRKLPGPIEFVNPLNGQYHPNGIAKIAGGPGGMMCVSRNCISRMLEHPEIRDRWYGQQQVTGKKAWPLFEFDIIDHERISEDMNFCRRWRELGGDVWVDPHLILHHHGRKTYSGRFADHLKDLGLAVDPGKIEKVAAVSMADML